MLGRGCTTQQVASEMGDVSTTVNNIKKNKDKVLLLGGQFTNEVLSFAKKDQNKILAKTEELLHVWIEDRRSNGFPLCGNLIRTQTKSLYADV